MTARLPSTEILRIAGNKVRADLADNISEVTLDYGVGQVAELTIRVLDPTGRLDNTALVELGGTVTIAGSSGAWEVGAIDADYGAGITWSYRCRSAVARQLRKRYKVGAEREVSPSEWVTRRVTELGGTITVQKSSKRIAIGQAGKEDAQSTLDVINSLAGELEWSWVERDGRLLFGDPYWAYTGEAKTLTYPVTWKLDDNTDALSVSVSLSDDDTESAGSIDLTLPYRAGERIRPWDRLSITGIGRYSGIWLVDTVAYPLDSIGPVSVSGSQPRKPRKKKGSS